MANQKISARTVLAGTGLISIPVARAGSSTDYRLVHNLSATSAPTTGDDDADGFSIGSLWVRSDTGEVYICRSASTGAAIWVKLAPAIHPGYIVGNWYLPLDATIGNNSSFTNVNFTPFLPRSRVTLDQLAARVNTGQVGGAFQLAIYANNPTTGRPTGTPLGVVTGAGGGAGLVATGAGVVGNSFSGGNVTLEAGTLYWLAIASNNGSISFGSLGANTTTIDYHVGTSTQANIITSASATFKLTLNSGTYNDSTPSTTFPDVTALAFAESGGGGIPAIAFRVASVP